MQDGNAKQQVVERVKSATNILVTVNSNPTVDELSAALGFTLMLNKMDKHATAVFSGHLPDALSFLKPDDTFEDSVDSLRDFIIALDKEKADRLRYKVEDDVVRIFITPYQTTITDKDLQFSQGDFNVELIVALGVEKREDLDKAIVAHGRILHDATVVTVNATSDKSSIGSIDWQDANASSLCEMLMSLSEALQPGLLDEQIATALLTGIVAATARFSNQYTTPRVMTMSAQLMAAGANQQLIATKLEEGRKKPVISNDGATYLEEGASSRVNKQQEAQKELPEVVEQPNAPKKDGEMTIEHEQHDDSTAAAPQSSSYTFDAPTEQQATSDSGSEQAYDVEKELSERLNAQIQNHQPTAPSVAQLSKDLAAESDQSSISLPSPQSADASLPQNTQPKKIHDTKPSWMGSEEEPPSTGSALSATSQQALEDSVRERENNRRHVLLSHDSKSGESAESESSVMPDLSLQFEESPIPTQAAESQVSTSEQVGDTKSAEIKNYPTLADLEKQAREATQQRDRPNTPLIPPMPPATVDADHDVDQARRAVDDALNGAHFDPANNPLQSVGAQAFPSIHHDQPAQQNNDSLPPLPDFSTLPPLPPRPQQEQSSTPFIDPNAISPDQVPTTPAVPQAPSTPPQQSNNPGQFQIPN